jgi:hypothetical protein
VIYVFIIYQSSISKDDDWSLSGNTFHLLDGDKIATLVCIGQYCNRNVNRNKKKTPYFITNTYI